MKTFLYTQGTRVRIRRGRFPLDGSLIGRDGLIVEIDEYRPGHYGVQLDDESRIRDFAEEELEPVERAGSIEEAGDTGPTVGP